MGAPEELVHWKKANLEALRSMSFHTSQIRDVTVVAYHYRRTPEELDKSFWTTEFAFLQTFKTQGILPSVLVLNESTPPIERFCKRFSVEIQIAKNLIPGTIRSLALDLVENLYARFKTPYVLTIQDDGFPLRPGLEEFVGKWDYVGAPWFHHGLSYHSLYPHKYSVGNGGFSLRSKRLCETASRIYKKWFRHLPYCSLICGDDTFYCKTLRFWFRGAVRGMKWPSPDEATAFSIEHDDGTQPPKPPLGFHSFGFMKYQRLFPDIISSMGIIDNAIAVT